MESIVDLENVTCAYAERAVLLNVSLHIHPGQFIGLIGPSGSGKTTLMRAILGTVEPRHGIVKVLGRPVIPGRATVGIGYVPQLETVDWNFPVTVEEVVLMGKAMNSGMWPWPSRKERDRMASVLTRLGIADLAGRHIRELSGGQQQRVFLARALLSDPKLLLLDEPTSGVDIKTRDDVLHLLADLNSDGVTILMTSHELNSVAAHLPWVICLNRQIVAQGTPEDVFTSEVLSRTYGAEIMVLRKDGVTLIGDIPHTLVEEQKRQALAQLARETAHAPH
jgi:zinc/manganese transport system ATP-binding protein/zinc transport system ATP-binding protein